MRIPFTRGIVLAIFALGAVHPVFPQASDQSVKVMTRNLYLGADLSPAIAAPDFNSFQIAVKEIWNQVQSTNFPERARAIAEEIRKEKPFLIGLQEATLWRTGPLLSPLAADEVRLDFIQLLRDQLTGMGLQYIVNAEVTNLDLEVPLVVDGFDLRMTDRGAILARADLDEKSLKVSNPRAANFLAVLLINVLGSSVEVRRGWTTVDAEIRGERFRFVNVHLESFAPAIRDLQAGEVLAGPANTTGPVVLVGDFNATPMETGTYGRMIAAGFSDAWVDQGPVDSGFTCCQEANLRNIASLLDRRIDFALFRKSVTDGRLRVGNVELVGVDQQDKTPSGLWPSDHAGVQAELRMGVRRRAVRR